MPPVLTSPAHRPDRPDRLDRGPEARSRRALRRPGRRLAAVVLLAAGLVVGGAVAASAHVSVDAGGAHQGADDALLTFRVPNERTGTRTVQVDISFPTRTPIASVRPATKAGWTVTTTRVTFATPITTPDGTITSGVGKVVFRATSPVSGIAEGSFDTFQVLAGPLPAGVATLAFPTVQTYANGQVSAWIQPAVAGTEPSHPAPVLTLDRSRPDADTGGVTVSIPGAPSAGSSGGPASGGPAPDIAVAAAPAPDVVTRDQLHQTQLLSLVGVVTGSAGMLAAGIAIGRSRRPANADGSS